jgi:hypothetical protein
MIQKILFGLLLFPALAMGQGIALKSGATSDLATVNTSKALLTQTGFSTKATYGASVGALSCNATNLLVIESAAGTGFKLASWCVSYSSVATAAAAINVFVRRETAASSGGTALTAEGTGTTSISQFVPGTGNYGGVARGGAATSGAAGATLDQVGFTIGELGAGVADPPSPGVFCRTYGLAGDQLPAVASGIANGIVISMSASGAGGLSNCALSAVIIAE